MTRSAWRWGPWALTAVFLLVAVSVIVVSGTHEETGAATAPSARVPCDVTTPITLASSSEKDDLLRAMAVGYEQNVPGPCAHVDVTEVNSGEAAVALGGVWDEGKYGPAPDVWSPAASIWAGVARSQPAGRGAAVVPEGGPSIAQTRLVLATPESTGRALGWPSAPLGWSDVVRLAQDPRARADRGVSTGPFLLGKTNPTVSTSGLFALLTALRAGHDPTVPLTEAAVGDPNALAFEKVIEDSVVHYGNTEQEFMVNLAAAARGQGATTYVNAVAVEEKSVWDYNRGNPSGDVPPRQLSPPAERLVAFPPREGGLVSDSPYLVLTRPGTTPAVRAAAEDFLRWLLEPSQQQTLQSNGFRDALGRPGPELSPDNGFAPGDTSFPQPEPAVAQAALNQWPRLRRAANVTMVIDRSGSMNTSVPGTGETRWEVAKDAAAKALARLGDDDTLSLWTFSTPRPGEPTPWTRAVEPGPARQRRAEVLAALDGIRPQGGTALYETTTAAVRAMRERFDPSRINGVVVLTDGKNEDTDQLDPGPMFTELPAGPGKPPVRVFSIAYGGESDLDTLRDIGEASGGYAYDARDPTAIDKAFQNLISNF